jgi:hypothetical protein
VRINFKENDKTFGILITPEEIAAVPMLSKARYFGHLLAICRNKIDAIAPKKR